MDNQKFGKLITKLRKEKGLTQKELAEKLYVTDKAVSKWERGLSFPDIELLLPIADLFSISVLELLKGERNTDIKLDNNLNENEIVIETLKNSKNIIKSKFMIPKWIKVILCIIFIWISFYMVDYICVSKYFSEPIFSISINSNKVQNGDADYIEKNYVGLGYSFYTRGQIDEEKSKYVIHYGEIKIINIKVKDFFKGVTQ
ncbi:MAG TPA: hypothetical protein DCE23_02950 [Firmicutes bacterium]|nr:hypothetical protein [Bacillota bacterium]